MPFNLYLQFERLGLQGERLLLFWVSNSRAAPANPNIVIPLVGEVKVKLPFIGPIGDAEIL